MFQSVRQGIFYQGSHASTLGAEKGIGMRCSFSSHVSLLYLGHTKWYTGANP